MVSDTLLEKPAVVDRLVDEVNSPRQGIVIAALKVSCCFDDDTVSQLDQQSDIAPHTSVF